MAHVTDDYEFTAQPTSGFPRRYDWDTWCDGHKWTLERGTDYDCKLSSLKQHIRREAVLRELAVRINVLHKPGGGESVVFQYYHPDAQQNGPVGGVGEGSGEGVGARIAEQL